MATTNVTMRMDEQLKSQLQELVSNLGLDMTTFKRIRLLISLIILFPSCWMR